MDVISEAIFLQPVIWKPITISSHVIDSIEFKIINNKELTIFTFKNDEDIYWYNGNLSTSFKIGQNIRLIYNDTYINSYHQKWINEITPISEEQTIIPKRINWLII